MQGENLWGMHRELTSVAERIGSQESQAHLLLLKFVLISDPQAGKYALRRLFVILCSQKLGLWQGVQVESSSASCTCKKEHGECMTTLCKLQCLFYFATHASFTSRRSSFCTTIVDCRLRLDGSISRKIFAHNWVICKVLQRGMKLWVYLFFSKKLSIESSLLVVYRSLLWKLGETLKTSSFHLFENLWVMKLGFKIRYAHGTHCLGSEFKLCKASLTHPS